ncbi:metallophosphoesterase [Clostridium pasteurianum DSM 525 = ATCC 6013]|uniref:Metallophosphoesterase n=1 Tax=Clostridium pasteurianum DSM 525 = ATCC 6013 TaxID=1262449 RepID=A0A0H3J3Z7_CLOPA|nr:metallophosphoesterase family protein [Clostridium pasteurianum]AJA48189.1 metallophosphoesterase [Clostridium pasteurianum DSM 525 = ATCC 6013]AJA52177.1 metallophosphoesterase [Clostridium pasteurianum DSM 525 = ATCC 6013]AOZ75448.1 metallophosphoesterase [Clostridium pasteurianum DSM 525 = ATCC 6013]AOZ79243.1 metallophosphoesterase [Clostridium pasteurianum]ELP60659.1 metallophosphoesterase [Clostridium pasteurianum DSM 525 = ATCC 6013]
MIKRVKKIVVLVLTTTMLFTTGITAFAGSEDGWNEAKYTDAAKNGAWDKWVKTWETVKNNPTEISLTPGRNASELNFAWYSKNAEPNSKFKIGKKQDLSDAKELNVKTENAVTGYKSNKATATGLEENTKYYYSYQVNGVWSVATPYKTQSTKSFSFLYVGDPQIGSSSSNIAKGADTTQGQDAAVRNDSFNWNNTINTALKSHPNVSFMLSAGDQIQTSSPKSDEQNIEYAGYLSPDALKSLPVATTIGNHDSKSPNYSYHFNNPNASTLGATAAGGDYYYSYGNTLFITLNTNNTNEAEHEQVIKKAISENPNAKWRIVTIHHDIYGSGDSHSNELSVIELRYKLAHIFEENKIDVVLTGHDHTYSRSFMLKGGVNDGKMMDDEDTYEEQYAKELAGEETTQQYKDYLNNIDDPEAIQQVKEDITYKNGNVVDPSGILYMTANSASGSKYYNLINTKQSYIATRWQEDIPTYSTIDIDEVSFTINTYRTDNGQKIDNTFSIIKSIDKSSLNELISAGEEKSKETFTPSSFNKLEKALAAAKAVSSKPSANSQEIADAYTNLKEGINGLEDKGDKTELKKSIDDAQALLDSSVVGNEEGQYPSEAKEKLQSAVASAKATVESDDATQSTVDKAVDALNEEIKGFKSKKVVKQNTETPGNQQTTSNNNSTTPNNNDSTASNNDNDSVSTTTSGKVKTGDDFNAYPIIAIAGVSAAALVYVNRKKKFKEAK